jgi:hypothetical protein
MKLMGSIAAVTAIAVTGTLAAIAAPNPAAKHGGIKANPDVFDPGKTGIAYAKWIDSGEDGGPGIVLAKFGGTSVNASAGVEFSGVKGQTLTKIGFDIRTDTDCGSGSPRFNVTIQGETAPHFFGCGSGDPSAGMTTTRTFTDGDGVEWETKEANIDTAGIEGQTLDSLEIVADEHGSSIIDNIVVNDTTIGKPSKKK